MGVEKMAMGIGSAGRLGELFEHHRCPQRLIVRVFSCLIVDVSSGPK